MVPSGFAAYAWNDATMRKRHDKCPGAAGRIAAVIASELGHKLYAADNDQGELVDQWRTPYSFHLESRRAVTIRSAGLDLIMYSEDDILSTPYPE